MGKNKIIDNSIETPVISAAGEENLQMLTKAPREPKKHAFADGEFPIPNKYKCTRCGKVHNVTQKTLVTRVEKKYGNKLKDYLANAVCSACKRIEKNDELIKKLQAKNEEAKAKIETPTV